jgi:hypothetical protein
MNINEMTTEELKEAVVQSMAGASLADMKWVYNYFSGHDEWPIITDEVKVPKYKMVTNEVTAPVEEECPF